MANKIWSRFLSLVHTASLCQSAQDSINHTPLPPHTHTHIKPPRIITRSCSISIPGWWGHVHHGTMFMGHVHHGPCSSMAIRAQADEASISITLATSTVGKGVWQLHRVPHGFHPAVTGAASVHISLAKQPCNCTV